MNYDRYLRYIRACGDRVILREQEPLSHHTTFRIGGPADLFLEPKDEETLRFLLRRAKEEGIRTIVIGRGSNLLFADAVTLKVDKKELSVNHTVRKNGWKIYLMNYSHAADEIYEWEYVHLLFRRDPGEFVVKAGAAMMIAGTVLELLIGNGIRTKKKEDGHD